MASKFLGVPLKMAGWRPKAGRLAIFKKYVQKNKVFSVIDQNDNRKVGKKQEKYWKNIFYCKLLEKIIFSHRKLLENIFSYRNL